MGHDTYIFGGLPGAFGSSIRVRHGVLVRALACEVGT